MVTIAFNLATVAIGFVSAIAGLSPDKKTEFLDKNPKPQMPSILKHTVLQSTRTTQSFCKTVSGSLSVPKCRIVDLYI